MAGKIATFDEYATKLYEPTKHETRMLVNALSGDTRFRKVHKPQTWAQILEYIETANHPDVTKEAFRNLWLSYSAYKRRNAA
jgi:hypothetical protein